VEPAVAFRHIVDEGRELWLLERRWCFARLSLAATAFLAAAAGAPDISAARDLGHGAPCGHAGYAIVDQRVPVAGFGIIVGDLLEHPWLGFLAGFGLQSEHDPFALHPLAFEGKVQMPFLDRLARILTRVGDPAALVPQHDGPSAIFAGGDRPLEIAIIEGMVLGAHCKALFVRVEARPFRHGPTLQHAAKFEPEIPVES
jgi:hypothetical protein